MKKSLFIFFVLYSLLFTGCTSDKMFEETTRTDTGATTTTDSLATAKLLQSLEDYNNSLGSNALLNCNQENTRGWRDIWGWIKIAWADGKGVAEGCAHRNAVEAAVRGVAYSVAAYLSEMVTSATAPSKVLSRDNIEQVYYNASQNPYLRRQVVEECKEVTPNLPVGYNRAVEVAVSHNMMLYMYSSLTSDSQLLPSNKFERHEYFSSSDFMTFHDIFLANLDEILTTPCQDMPDFYFAGFGPAYKTVLGLYFEALEKVEPSAYLQISNDYICIIEDNPDVFKPEEKNGLYSAFTTLLYSSQFWESHLAAYEIRDSFK